MIFAKTNSDEDIDEIWGDEDSLDEDSEDDDDIPDDDE